MRLLRPAALLAAMALVSGTTASAVAANASSFPQYDHVFLILDENLSYSQVIGSPDAPEINALAADFGIAGVTHYTGVGDPSEPNYVAMLGGSTFGISDDNPYFWPGHTVNQPNLMSQLEGAGATTAADGSTYAAGWYADPSTGNYLSLIEHGTGGVWSIDTTPNPGTSSNGFASIAAIPGGGLWAVGNDSNNGNNATLAAHHC